MKTTVMVAALLLATSAFAQEKKETEKPPVTQTQTQSQSATGGAATASSAGQANSNVNETRVPRQAPFALAPDVYPSAPCRVGWGGAASAPIGGLSVGGSKLDDECDKRETARAFSNLGFREAALKILCTTKAARKALGEGCHKMKPSREWTEENSLTFPN